MHKYLFILFIGCSSASAISTDNTPRKLTLQVCRDFCEDYGVESFTSGYYFKGKKLCSIESNMWYCTTKDTINFACECKRVWSK